VGKEHGRKASNGLKEAIQKEHGHVQVWALLQGTGTWVFLLRYLSCIAEGLVSLVY
jgi:hypothetical protein